MPRPRDHRLEPANQLVLALCPGIETLQPFGNGKVHALVETGLEMQPVELIQAAPVTAVEAVAPDQAEGHGHLAPPCRAITTRIASGMRSASRLKNSRVR
jgi:hypothetical protein